MSPFLFALAMEYLRRRYNEIKEQKLFKFHPKCSKLVITHLSFEVDLLLFSIGDQELVKQLHIWFQDFSEASCLQANSGKTAIVFGGVLQNVQTLILQLLGLIIILSYRQKGIPFKYLEIPLSSKNISLIQWKPLINNIMPSITSWTAKTLSYDGRAQLVKTVLFHI